MSTTPVLPITPRPAVPGGPPPAARRSGPIGRLGRWAATNTRAVFIAWVVVALGLGLLAPRVEHALSGAGWQASGSESVQVRDLVQREFGGLNSTGLMVVVHSASQTTSSQDFKRTIAAVAATLKRDGRVASVALPRSGATISRDVWHRTFELANRVPLLPILTALTCLFLAAFVFQAAVTNANVFIPARVLVGLGTICFSLYSIVSILESGTSSSG